MRNWRAMAMMCAALCTPRLAGKVMVFAGPGADFSSYKTYQWLPTRVLTKTGLVEDDPVLTPIIKAAVNRELAARGLKEVAEGADLEVSTCAATTYVPQLEALLFPTGYWWDYQVSPAPIGRYNREGAYAINLIDVRRKKAAWTAIITQAIDNKPGAGAKKIPKATETLFKKYPVKK